MNECFKCGIPESITSLFDAVSEKGIVKVCKECSFNEQIPIVRKPSSFDFKNVERKQTVHERLSRAAGLHPEKSYLDGRKEILKKQDTSLRDLVEKNYQKNRPLKSDKKTDLVDNFHWVIMRARRAKHLSQKQLAEGIAESEISIKMAEKGILPESYSNFIFKLENYLGIKLSKKELEKKFVEDVKFDPVSTKILTLSDLKKMNPEQERKALETKAPQNKEEDLSSEEIDDLIFGRK
ncbi:MAG: hypothetical protein KKF68_03655 [Nanoarchaeota archaeon]|nr:hypothetical protein [Nanoarchaeota archaeon]